MLSSFSEFKFFQSFRIPVETADDLRCLVEREDELGKGISIGDARLVDISVTGLGFKTVEGLSVGLPVHISLQFKKYHLDLTGRVVRAFSNSIFDEEIIYGIEIDDEPKINKFLEHYVTSFSPDRARDCLVESALQERYTKASDGFEMFSLLLSLFKDITHFGDKEGFVDNMLEEVVRILNASRASIFLINPESNELEAFTAMGIEDKNSLKFDYRLGIAGSVFTTGIALNIDTVNDKTRFNREIDEKTGFQTKSIICYPIHNREDKVIGVIEVLNKRNQDRFAVEDEKTMKVLALVFSSVFHNFNPISEISQIRRFSTPFDREHVLIGKTTHIASLRNTILKIKDIDQPVLIQGEDGVGKELYAKILHFEGRRGLNLFEKIECCTKDIEQLERELFYPSEDNKWINCQGGSLLLREIGKLSLKHQSKFLDILVNQRIEGSVVSLDARIMATTSLDLGQLVDQGEFIPELYDYLNKAMVSIEPLRRRKEDVALLIDYFLKVECKKQGLLLKNLSPKAIDYLCKYDWTGNVQELKTCIERAVLYNPKTHIISEIDLQNTTIPLMDLNARRRSFGDIPYVDNVNLILKDRLSLVERELIMAEIKRHNGNKSKAAKAMGISREALRKKLLFSDELYERLSGDSVIDNKAA